MKPLITIRRVPKIDFMRWHRLGFLFSGLLTALTIVLYLTVGLNYGIDFLGGTLVEARTTTGPADLAEMRSTLDFAGPRRGKPAGIWRPRPRADPVGGAARRRRGADAGGSENTRGARSGDRISPHRNGRPERRQRADPGGRARHRARPRRDHGLCLVPLRVAVRRWAMVSTFHDVSRLSGFSRYCSSNST